MGFTENPGLDLGDLTLNLQDIQGQPVNVQKWLFRLIAGDGQASRYRDIIELGVANDNSDIRENLAAGFIKNYFPGCEEFIAPWLVSESDASIRMLILDHMAMHSDKHENYSEFVTSAFQDYAMDSPQRKRLLVASAGKKLHGDLKRIDIGQDFGLLKNAQPGYGGIIMNTNFNFGDNNNVGMINSNSNFSESTINNVQKVSDPGLKALLEEVINFSSKNDLTKKQAEEISAKVDAITKKPSKITLTGLADALKTVAAMNGASELIHKVIEFGHSFIT